MAGVKKIGFDCRSRRGCAGFSLVEMMVSMTIGLVVIAAAGQLFISSKRIFNLQQIQSSFQEQATLLGTMIYNLLRQTGNIDVSSASIVREQLFRENATFPANGQTIIGVSGTTTRTVLNPDGAELQTFPTDAIAFRFEGGPGILDCAGNPTTAGTYYEHALLINDYQLICRPAIGADPVALIGVTTRLASRSVRVLGLKILYGVDENGDGSINDYNRAAEMTAPDWKAVINSWLDVTIQAGDLPPVTMHYDIHYANLSPS